MIKASLILKDMKFDRKNKVHSNKVQKIYLMDATYLKIENTSKILHSPYFSDCEIPECEGAGLYVHDGIGETVITGKIHFFTKPVSAAFYSSY